MRFTTIGLAVSLAVSGCANAAPSEAELRCEQSSDCVLSSLGCCPVRDGIAIRGDAEAAYFARTCPEGPEPAPACPSLAICPTAFGASYAVATCDLGRCARLDFQRGTGEAVRLRSCDTDLDCVAHDRCARFGQVDCRAPDSVLVVALSRAGAAEYETRVDGCVATTTDAVACIDGLCELRTE